MPKLPKCEEERNEAMTAFLRGCIQRGGDALGEIETLRAKVEAQQKLLDTLTTPNVSYFDMTPAEEIARLEHKVKEIEATIGCLGIGTDADECAKKWMVAAQSMADDRERYRAALNDALDPLDLYNAYGWPDRNGVRARIRAILNPK